MKTKIITSLLVVMVIMASTLTVWAQENNLDSRVNDFLGNFMANNMYRWDMADFMKTVENQEDIVIIDVRPPDFYAKGYIEGSINIPVPLIHENLSKIPQKKIAVVCTIDANSAIAVTIPRLYGFDASYVVGGIPGWEQAGGKLVQWCSSQMGLKDSLTRKCI